MARTIVVRMSDDLDRSLEATETRELGYGGFIHVLDLTQEHANELDELLKPYLKAAHEKVRWPRRQIRELLKDAGTPEPLPTGDKAQSDADRELRQRMRAWGRKNGFPNVADRGNVPKDLKAAFNEAHKGRKK